MPRVLLVIVIIAVTVYAFVEAMQADPHRVRVMPRWLWFVAILVVPILGPVCWFALGRPAGGIGPGPQRRQIAPDDDPDFLRGL